MVDVQMNRPSRRAYRVVWMIAAILSAALTFAVFVTLQTARNYYPKSDYTSNRLWLAFWAGCTIVAATEALVTLGWRRWAR